MLSLSKLYNRSIHFLNINFGTNNNQPNLFRDTLNRFILLTVQ